jgi:CheY-like chemotaxis protein
MASAKPASPRGSPKGLLLCIDDAEPLLEILAGMLEAYGYSVIASANAKDGLRIFQRKKIDLVILDQEMPEVYGHEIAQEMKRINPAVPIILHSGCVDLPDEAFKVADAVVSKGASFTPLISEVAEIMASRRASPGNSSA